MLTEGKTWRTKHDEMVIQTLWCIKEIWKCSVYTTFGSSWNKDISNMSKKVSIKQSMPPQSLLEFSVMWLTKWKVILLLPWNIMWIIKSILVGICYTILSWYICCLCTDRYSSKNLNLWNKSVFIYLRFMRWNV